MKMLNHHQQGRTKDFSDIVETILSGNRELLESVESNDYLLNRLLQNLPIIDQKIQRIIRAVEKGDLHLLKQLLTRKKLALVKEKSSESSLLHKSVVKGHENISSFLTKYFPELLSSVDSEGRTPLHIAALKNDKNIYQLLIDKGANVFASDNFNKSPADYMLSQNINIGSWKTILGTSQYSKLEKCLSFCLNILGQEKGYDPIGRLAQLMLIYEMFKI